MKKLFKLFLYLILVVAILVVGFLSYITLRGIPKYEVDKIDFPQVQPDSSLQVLGEKIAAVQCIVCHQGSDGKLSGRLMAELPPEFGEIHSANITQSKEHGIGNWTDVQIVELLRTGVKPNGQYIPIYMPKFPHLSETDIKAILTFLHSKNKIVESSEITSVSSHPSFLVKFLCLVAFKKMPYPIAPIPEPDINNAESFGKYLVTGRYDCYTCHSADFKTLDFATPEKSPGFLGGGNTLITMSGNKIFTANITPDDKTGIGTWTEDDFKEAMLHKKNKQGKDLRNPMLPYNGMTDQEIHAIWTYILSVPKICNSVDRQWDKEL